MKSDILLSQINLIIGEVDPKSVTYTEHRRRAHCANQPWYSKNPIRL